MSNKSSCREPQSLVASVLPPIMTAEFLLGFPGNAVALWVFCCRQKTANTVYLLNLVLADFLLLVGLPFRIDSLLRGEDWVFGDAFCRLNLFMLAVNRSASIAFMTVVAVDRFFKVVHPHHAICRLSVRCAVKVVSAIWVTVLLLHLPLLLSPMLEIHGNSSKRLCRSFHVNVEPTPGMMLHNALFLAEFFLPFLLLLFCSVRITCFLHGHRLSKNRKVRRATQVVLLIVGLFAICFLPSVIAGLVALFIGHFRPGDCRSFLLAGQLFVLSVGFTYLNSALDPIIYCFSSSEFRNTLKSSLNRFGLFQPPVRQREGHAATLQVSQ